MAKIETCSNLLQGTDIFLSHVSDVVSNHNETKGHFQCVCVILIRHLSHKTLD